MMYTIIVHLIARLEAVLNDNRTKHSSDFRADMKCALYSLKKLKRYY